MTDDVGPDLIPVAYDLEKHPKADEFDPIAWYEGTGEDLGLPADYLKHQAEIDADIAAQVAKYNAEPEPPD